MKGKIEADLIETKHKPEASDLEREIDRSYMVVAAVDGKVIFFGGKRVGSYSDQIDLYYDAQSGRWEKKEANEARGWAAVAVVGTKAFSSTGERAVTSYKLHKSRYLRRCKRHVARCVGDD